MTAIAVAVVPRAVRALAQPFRDSVRTQCRRSFSTGLGLYSGHNRWSKIRHGKGAADAKKTAVRTSFAKSMTLYSQLYGPDIETNRQLATVVAAAKKAGVPKATIEAAIARGQGRSAEGQSLETVTYEFIMPPAVAVIVDIETDNKQRVFQDLNSMVKKKNATITPTKFFFSRLGRVVFARSDDAGLDDVMDDAIEAGAEDLETDEDGNVVVWTQPYQTNRVVQDVGAKFGLKVLGAETIWTPGEDTRAKVGSSDEVRRFTDLLVSLQNYPDVRAVYSNAIRGDETPEEAWSQLEQYLDT